MNAMSGTSEIRELSADELDFVSGGTKVLVEVNVGGGYTVRGGVTDNGVFWGSCCKGNSDCAYSSEK